MSAQTYTTDQKLVFIAKEVGAECLNLRDDWLYCDYEDDNSNDTKLIGDRVRKAFGDDIEKALEIMTECAANDVWDDELTEEMMDFVHSAFPEGLGLDADKYPMYPAEAEEEEEEEVTLEQFANLSLAQMEALVEWKKQQEQE